MPRLAAALAALLPLAIPIAVRGEEGLDLWVEAGAGVDTNPARGPGAAGQAQGFTSLLGRGRARWGAEGGQVVFALTEAGRLYPGASGSDALASRVELGGRAALPAGLALAATASASDYSERDGLLDRHTLRGEATLSLRRGVLGASIAGGWSLFAPRDQALRPFRSEGPTALLRTWWVLSESHELAGSVGRAHATFPGWRALGAPGAPERNDDALQAAVEWWWRGPALASAGWAFTRNRSDALGGDFVRHRLTASAALHLPWELTLAARAALQWTHYPDPLLLAAQQRLAEGQENLDTLEARLSRPLVGAFELSLSLAWYHADGGAGMPGYARGVATVGLGWRGGPARPRRRVSARSTGRPARRRAAPGRRGRGRPARGRR